MQGLLTDTQIIDLCLGDNMISPFSKGTYTPVGNIRLPSKGLSSVGYDVGVNPEQLRLSTYGDNPAVLDLLNPDSVNQSFITVDYKVDENGLKYFDLEQNHLLLAVTNERFKMPRDVTATCTNKSTYARCGILVMVTPLEPEWEGYLTLEIVNTHHRPVRLYLDGGIAQLQFTRVGYVTESYKDKKGKYMDQPANPVLPKV